MILLFYALENLPHAQNAQGTQLVQHRVHDIHAPAVAGPGDPAEFRRLSALLLRLQEQNELKVVRDESSGQHVLVSLKAHGHDDYSNEAREVIRLLDLLSNAEAFKVHGSRLDADGASISIRGRSVLGAMFYLAQGVDVPADDAAAHAMDVGDQGPHMRVRQSKKAPKNPYVAVRYRGRWFYIDDDDVASKRTFAFLTFVFNLTSAPGGAGPMLTVGAGG